MQTSNCALDSADSSGEVVVTGRLITEAEMKLISGSGPVVPEASCW